MSFSPLCKIVLNANATIEAQAIHMAAVQEEAHQEVEDCIRQMESDPANPEYMIYWKGTGPSKTQENIADAAKGDEK